MLSRSDTLARANDPCEQGGERVGTVPVPMMRLISREVVVPMLLARKLLGSSHANVQIH